MESNNLDIDKTEKSAAGFQGSGRSTGFEKIFADKLHDAAKGHGEKAGESATAEYGKEPSEWLEHSAEYVKQADATIREYVKQNPGRSLLIAGAVGLVFGAILRRR